MTQAEAQPGPLNQMNPGVHLPRMAAPGFPRAPGAAHRHIGTDPQERGTGVDGTLVPVEALVPVEGSAATLPTPGLSGSWSSRLRRACDLPGVASPAPLIPPVPLSWRIRVLRLITGTPAPRIDHEARINHDNEPQGAAVTEAACQRAFPWGLVAHEPC
jgi:hypothetical protein